MQMFSSKNLLLIVLLGLVSLNFIQAAPKKSTALYDSSKSTVYLLNKDNFDKQVTKHRQRLVSIVHYYKHDDQGSKEIAFEFDKFATELQGVFKIAAVDCYKDWDLCDKEKIVNTPVVRIYPPLPIPAFDYEGDYSSKAITASAGKFVGNKVVEINGTNINKFIQDTPSVPKCLLFTDKPGFPLIYKALSVDFDQKIFLGVIRKEETELFERYGVKKTPTILVVKPTEKKSIPYKGDINYKSIFDFLNVYTETFVPGGDELANDKPWTREMLPELTAKSAGDICFNIDGALCAIYLTKTTPDASITSAVEEILRKNKETNFKYMWLNVENNSAFANLFGAASYPSVVIYSHGKVKKFVTHEGDISSDSILATLEKINNGDARFNRIKQDIPSLN